MDHEQYDEDLIGYLLGAMDDDAKAQLDAHLQANPDTRRHLDALRQALLPLSADKEASLPPPGLAARTIARIAEHCCQASLPRPIIRAEPPRSWWRRADLVVAASLLLMALGIGLPALLRLHEGSRGPAIVECQNNLRVFSEALHVYHDRHGRYPSVVEERPRDAAGMVAPILVSAGVLREPASVRCPGNGPGFPCPMTLEQLHSLSVDEFTRQSGNLIPSYAYSLGHRDEEGNYFGPVAADGQQDTDFPLLADAPPMAGGPGNSDNHGGAGQNVLFADGHVSFMTLRNIGFNKDDIYTNKANKVAAGLDPLDIVLGPSAAKP
jgi:prepilin-type processing-associated H-X9-DG protein